MQIVWFGVLKRKIYFDVCCLNRPFDDWAQERIPLEGEAVVNIAARIRSQDWYLVASEAIAIEFNKMTDLDKLESVREILKMATIKVGIDDGIKERSH